jgi:hypothetical protein
MCLAALHAVFGRADVGVLVRAVIALGAAFHVALVVATGVLARAATSDRRAAWLAAAATALATPLAVASFSGMEVTLTALLLVTATHACVTRRWTRAGLLLGASILARPESLAVVVAITLIAYWPARRGRDRANVPLLRLLVPACVVAIGVVAYDLWASGLPLPATFYAKSSGGLAALPSRAWIALARLFTQVPPFAGGVAWLALVGFVVRRGDVGRVGWLPLAAGVAYAAANLAVVEPGDPPAFYHLRYVLPAVPLLLVALVQGAHFLGRSWGGRASSVPGIVLVALSIVGAARTFEFESRHFHNDVRNINEVQRRIGTWLGERVPPDVWIAASDAGAIRYCSNRPTVDVIGLNTPEMLTLDEDYVRSHPVAAVALLPAWFRPRDPNAVAVVLRAETRDYTVTSDPRMAVQVVLVPAPENAGERVRVRYSGFHAFELDLRTVGRVANEPTDAP